MATQKPFIVGAGQPSLEDVLRVIFGQPITLDSAAADRVKKESPPPKSFEPEAAPSIAASQHTECLDRVQTRATLLVKLCNLINGKSKCRLAVLETITAFLNSNVIPVMTPSDLDSAALHALANALHGVGKAVSANSIMPANEALEGAGIAIPGLSSAERSVIEDGQAASAGTGAICVQSGKALVTTATAIAALSAEALLADVSVHQTRPLLNNLAISTSG